MQKESYMLKIKRYGGNPILGPNPDLPWAAREARNPGVIFDGEKFHMVFSTTAVSRNNDIYPCCGEIYLGHAVSTDGFHFECDPEPFMRPSPNMDDFDCGTVEDCRITAMEGKYYIAYAGRASNMQKNHERFRAGQHRVGPQGQLTETWMLNYRRVGVAVTENWKDVKRLGPLTSEHLNDSNVAIFPEKINGKYAFLHRPMNAIAWTLPGFYEPGSIWLAYTDSLDKVYFSDRKEMPWNMDFTPGKDIPDDHRLIVPQEDWERAKIGASGVPIPTDDGWLVFYHGVAWGNEGGYRVGLMLLDREDPTKVLARCPMPVMEPEMPYEKAPGTGYPNCIFPCATILVGDEIYIYYGACDTWCCLATVKLRDALEEVKRYI